MEKKDYEFRGVKLPGGLMVLIQIALLAGAGALLLKFGMYITAITLMILFFLTLFGYVIVEPNDSRVMVFFGKYNGTITDTGFFWVVPFYSKRRIYIRAKNLDVPPIKVNDKSGNPIMIGLVLVWKVKDTYRASFDIDVAITVPVGNQAAQPVLSNASQRMKAYEEFVKIQSDSALRCVAGLYPYDSQEIDGIITLRSGNKEVITRLEDELSERLSISGIEIVEARINYLAYAPEIAGAMLRRQQAEAIISAREKIVEGAVTMVHLALNKLAQDNVINLDDDKKAAMVSNLLVVLCADEQVQPVVNTGTLYN